MSYQLNPGEIIYCNLKLNTMEKRPCRYLIEKVSLTRGYDESQPDILLATGRILKKAGIKTDCKIVEIDLIHVSGMAVKY